MRIHRFCFWDEIGEYKYYTSSRSADASRWSPVSFELRGLIDISDGNLKSSLLVIIQRYQYS